jgi:transaldolase/glucose-6-phosphate isomerase
LEDLIARGGNPARIASVAGFFVSRIGSAVDKLLEARPGRTADNSERLALKSAHGKVAIANAKLAYQRYKRLFAGPRCEALRAKGAPTQRVLWASTGTKNPEYSDVLYVEELIDRDTINTMPPGTMDAFREHGKLRASLEEDLHRALHIMEALERLGISIDEVTAKVLDDGIHLFADAMDKLLGAIAHKRPSAGRFVKPV